MFNEAAYLAGLHFTGGCAGYDIPSLETGGMVAVARQQSSFVAEVASNFIPRCLFASTFRLSRGEGEAPVMVLDRSPTLMRTAIRVVGGGGEVLGRFRSWPGLVGYGGFDVYNSKRRKVACVKSDRKGREYGLVGPGSGGIGSIVYEPRNHDRRIPKAVTNHTVRPTPGQPQAGMCLLISAAIAVDLVFKQ